MSDTRSTTDLPHHHRRRRRRHRHRDSDEQSSGISSRRRDPSLSSSDSGYESPSAATSYSHSHSRSGHKRPSNFNALVVRDLEAREDNQVYTPPRRYEDSVYSDDYDEYTVRGGSTRGQRFGDRNREKERDDRDRDRNVLIAIVAIVVGLFLCFRAGSRGGRR